MIQLTLSIQGKLQVLSIFQFQVLSKNHTVERLPMNEKVTLEDTDLSFLHKEKCPQLFVIIILFNL